MSGGARFRDRAAGRQSRRGRLSDGSDVSGKMADLQKMRVALVILTSQETSKLLSRRQRVAGKEIEVMCAERDVHEQGDAASQERLDQLMEEDARLRAALRETEEDIEKMEATMARINADIAALCQA